MAKKNNGNGAVAELPRIELEVHTLALSTSIVSSPFQRRRATDEKKLNELAEAYRRGDPIPRPLARWRSGVGTYPVELVYGHRRVRAAERAGLTTLEVNVAELTDSQARHYQWEENAGREDLHPLDEADLFADWIQTETAEEIAARIGRGLHFVRARVKLAKLFGPGREAFLKGELGTGQAQLIAGLPEERQPEVLEVALRVDWQGGRPSLSQLTRWLEQSSLDLADAPWTADDAGLVPEVGACEACPKRTGATRDLFVGVTGDRCLDRACWDRKLTAQIERGGVQKLTMAMPGVWIDGTPETFEAARRELQREVDADARDGVGQARTVTDEEVRATLRPEQLGCEHAKPAVDSRGYLGKACTEESCATHGAEIRKDRERAARDQGRAAEQIPAAAARFEQQEKAAKEKDRLEQQARILTLNAMLEKLPLPGGKLRRQELLLVVEHFALSNGKLLTRHPELQGKPAEVLKKAKEPALYSLLFEAVFMADLNTWAPAQRLWDTAKALKVELAQIRQGLAAEKKKAKKAEKAKAKATPKKPRAKKAKP